MNKSIMQRLELLEAHSTNRDQLLWVQEVLNRMREAAANYDPEAKTIPVKFQEEAQHMTTEEQIANYEAETALLKKALSGDVAAQKFWLTNRRPDRWSDKVEQAVRIEPKGDSLIEAVKVVSANLFLDEDINQEDK